MAMSRRSRRWMLAGCLAATLILVPAALYVAARHEPAFYREAMTVGPPALNEGSKRMLRQVAALESAAQRDGRWEVRITADEINGWLAVDRAQNHPSSLPPTMHDPRVVIRPNEILIACRFEQGWIDSVLNVAVEPYLAEPNVVSLRIVRVRAGLLPMPMGRVLDAVSSAARNMRWRLEWRRADNGDPVAMLSPPTDKDDDRTVRIESLQLGDGAILAIGSTQRRKP